MTDIYTAARAVLEADERGQGQGYAEAMDALRAALAAAPDAGYRAGAGDVTKLAEALRELAGYASYAEIVGGIHVNRPQVREWCDKAFEVLRAFPEDEDDDALAATPDPGEYNRGYIDCRDWVIRSARLTAGMLHGVGLEDAAAAMDDFRESIYAATPSSVLTPPAEPPHSFTDPIVRLAVKDAATKVATAVAEGLTPPAPWAPPPEGERPYNYECLGWIYGGWDFVFWVDDHWQTRRGNRCHPSAFLRLPPTPEERA